MKCATFFLLMSLTRCTTTAPVGEKTVAKTTGKPELFVIGAGVVHPEALAVNTPTTLAKTPAGTLLISRVIRPRAEVREGPGINFSLSDRILEEDDRVIVFEVHGVWTKILSIKSWESGWVHAQVLSPPELNKKQMTINFARFPTVLAVRPLNYVGAFTSGDTIKLDEIIPKGKLFRALQVTNEKTLIWMAENNSIVWIKGRDMQ